MKTQRTKKNSFTTFWQLCLIFALVLISGFTGFGYYTSFPYLWQIKPTLLLSFIVSGYTSMLLTILMLVLFKKIKEEKK